MIKDKDLRLRAVRYARRVQHLLGDSRSIRSLDVADRHASGEATDEDLATAHAAAKVAAQSMEYVFETSARQSDLRAVLMSAKRDVEWNDEDRSKAWATALSTAEALRRAAERSAAQAAAWASDSVPMRAAEYAAHWSAAAVAELFVSEFARQTARLAEDGDPAGLTPLQHDEWRRTLDAIAEAAMSTGMEKKKAEMVHTDSQADPNQSESLEGFVATRDEGEPSISNHVVEITQNLQE